MKNLSISDLYAIFKFSNYMIEQFEAMNKNQDEKEWQEIWESCKLELIYRSYEAHLNKQTWNSDHHFLHLTYLI